MEPGFSWPKKNNKPPQNVNQQMVNAINSKLCKRLEFSFFRSVIVAVVLIRQRYQ